MTSQIIDIIDKNLLNGTIIEKITNNTYIIKHNKTKKKYQVNISNISPRIGNCISGKIKHVIMPAHGCLTIHLKHVIIFS